MSALLQNIITRSHLHYSISQGEVDELEKPDFTIILESSSIWLHHRQQIGFLAQNIEHNDVYIPDVMLHFRYHILYQLIDSTHKAHDGARYFQQLPGAYLYVKWKDTKLRTHFAKTHFTDTPSLHVETSFVLSFVPVIKNLP